MTSVVFAAQIRAEGLLQFKARVIATKGFIFLFSFLNGSKFKNCKPCVCLSSLQRRVLYSTMVSEISPKSNKLHPYPSIKRRFVLQPGKAGLKLGTRNLFRTTRQLTSTMMEMSDVRSSHRSFVRKAIMQPLSETARGDREREKKKALFGNDSL